MSQINWNWDISERDTISITYDGLSEGEVINSSTWTLDAGLVNEGSGISGNQVSLKLSFNGLTYPISLTIRNVVTTTGHSTGARQNGKTIYLVVQET